MPTSSIEMLRRSGDIAGYSFISSSAVGDFDQMMKLYPAMSPLRRNISMEEVGKTGVFLLSDHSSGITGETVHVDAGFHVMGAPPAEMKS